MDKKISQRIHAKTRAAQRYHASLNREDLFAIVQLIQANQSVRIEKKTNRITIHKVMYKEKEFIVAYDKSRKSIASFLPPDCQELHDFNKISSKAVVVDQRVEDLVVVPKVEDGDVWSLPSHWKV